MSSTPSADSRRWIALILLCAAQFVVVLDASIVNVALPSIGRALHFSEQNLQWVVNAYVLVFGGFLLLGGRMADLLGRRRVFMAGLVLFGLASLAGGLASSEGTLIAARAVQGLGAAILSPAALSIVTTTFAEGSERNRALGIWGAVAGSGGAAGVLLGGVLTDSLGWEWVFFVNTPIALAAAFLAPRLIDESREEERVRNFDAAGAVTVTAGLSLLVYTMIDATNVGWGSTQTIVLLIVSVALLVAFVVIELRSRAPLVPFRVFRLPNITGANVSGLLIGASLFSMFFFVSLYMQQVLGYSPLKSGFSYLPLALTIIVSAGVASQLVTKFGFKPILASGMGLIAIGLLLFSRVPVDGTFAADVLPASLVAAAGPRLLLRAGHDRRGVGRPQRRRRARVGPDQHLAADRRRARARGPVDDLDLAHQRRDGGRPRRARRAAARAHGGLLLGVHGGRGVRDPRRGARPWC